MIPNMKSLRKVSGMRKEIAAEIAAWETGERDLNAFERMQLQWHIAWLEIDNPGAMVQLIADEPCEYTLLQRMLAHDEQCALESWRDKV